MLEEVPRQHVIDTLLVYAKARALPPTWAVERWSQHQQPKRGRPKRNVLVDKIRALAVLQCAIRGQDKYELAAKFLRRIPARMFCGLSVAASSSAIKKSFLAVLGNNYPENMFRVHNESLLREYLPLLAEVLCDGPKKT
jgi:hypothetical protein